MYNELVYANYWCLFLCQKGTDGFLGKTICSFYENRRAYVRIGGGITEWFPVNFGVMQRCIM